MIREGTAAHNLEALLPLLTEKYAERWWKKNGFEVKLLKRYQSKSIYEISRDGLTRKEEIPYTVLHKITNRITNEVEGINRVLYDLTPKPTGTIEWE